MNEIRPRKDPEPQPLEVEPVGDGSYGPSPLVDADPRTEVFGSTPTSSAHAQDRRVAHRYRAVNGRCWLGWQDAVQFRQSAAWIIDIGASGTLVATDDLPPDDRSIWLRLDNPDVPEWAETRLVQVQASRSGIYAARLVFRGTCPYAIIKAVVFSAPGRQDARPGPSATWDHNAW